MSQALYQNGFDGRSVRRVTAVLKSEYFQDVYLIAAFLNPRRSLYSSQVPRSDDLGSQRENTANTLLN